MDDSTESMTRREIKEPGLTGSDIFYLISWCIAMGAAVAWAAWYQKSGLTGINNGIIVVGILITHMILALKIVAPDQIGAIVRLGSPIVNALPGPHFLFWPLDTIVKTSGLDIQQQFPENPEKVFLGKDDQPLPEGMYRPIRVVCRDDQSTPDPLSRSIVVIILLVSSFRILDYVAFLCTIGTIEQAMRQIRDMLTRAAQNEMAKITLREAMIKKEEISTKLFTEVEKMVASWGIELRAAYLERIILPADIAQELGNVPITELRARQTEITADAERKKREKEGTGDAAAILAKGTAQATVNQLLLEAQGKGTKAVAELLGIKEGFVVLVLQSYMKMMETASHNTLISNSGSDPLALVASIQQFARGIGLSDAIAPKQEEKLK